MNLLDRKVIEMEVKESGEKLVAIPKELPNLVLDENVELGYQNQFIARESVVLKLVEASRSLPNGLFLSVKETYRPLDFQETIFNRRVNRLRSLSENKNLSIAQIHEIAAQFIAPPHVAGHPTGGAVDVSLLNENGAELDLGCDYDEDEESSNGRCFSHCSSLSAKTISNRKILFESMEKAGFVNYPYEWWHWSFGDKYWAAVTESAFAIYSVTQEN